MADGGSGISVSSDPNMPKIGERVLQRYDVIRHLGEGGFASVFEAVDTRASGNVAIKVLHTQKSFDESFAKRFRQEIMVCRQLQHPNSIKITDAGTTEKGCLFMVMEFVTGRELIGVLAEQAPLSTERVTHISVQVLSALAEAHEKGIVHRDLKPANIMIGRIGAEEDFVKVLDFGIAKALVSDLQQVETQAGMVFCTPNYAAPEILLSKGVKPAADVYSFGLIMIEMMTGSPAVSGSSQAAVIAAQLSAEPAKVPDVYENTPLGAVIRKAVVKNLEERYQTAGQMLVDLRQVVRDARISGSYSSVPGTPSGQIDANVTRPLVSGPVSAVIEQPSRAGLWIVLVLFMLCLAGGGVLYVLMNVEVNGQTDGEDVGADQPIAAVADVEEDIEPEPVEIPVWQGLVVRPYEGEPRSLEGPLDTIVNLRRIDESAQLNRLAMGMLQRALLSQEFDQDIQIEVAEEYVQVVENLVGLLLELELCDGAARRLENAFSTGFSLTVGRSATPRINAMRSEIRTCRSLVEEREIEWDSGDYEDLAEDAQTLYEQAYGFSEDEALQSELIFFDSLTRRRQAAHMLTAALNNDEIRERHIEGASRDLLHLLELIVHTELELDLRYSAEVQLEQMLANSSLLPAESVGQVQELQLLVATENELAAEALNIQRLFDIDAPWELATYSEIVRLADVAYQLTRVAPPEPELPDPNEEPPPDDEAPSDGETPEDGEDSE